MITKQEFKLAQQNGKALLQKTSIHLNETEYENITVADFGLSNLEIFGAQILTLVNTDLISVKLIALTPFQILPEHWHPKIGEYAGKEETIRVEWGDLFMNIPGKKTLNPRAHVPPNEMNYFDNWNEQIMLPGNQITLQPLTPHWFQAGEMGSVIWSFSSKALDLNDEFTDKRIIRETIIED